MNKVILVTVSFAICMACGVHSENDYHLPPGPPPTNVFIHGGKPLRAPDSRPKYIERYVSSEFHLFGGRPPLPPPPKRFRLPHPNALPRGPKEPFDIVRAPIIYHQTVTDTDVTRAIADAFDVVEKLRKPGKNKGTSAVLTSMPVPSPPTLDDNKNNVITNVEFVNHFSQAPRTTGTTTTTIVEAPQQVEVVQPLVAQRPVPILLKSSALVQGQYPAIPSAHDLPPLPVSVATSTPLIKEEIVPVGPATTTSTSPTNLVVAPQAPSPKLIIPSQSHVTTLAEAVEAPGNPQVRTIIQPVYIPYPVDQNGQPVGPLPDYHTMDFRAIISAQNKLVVQDAPTSQPPQPQLQPQPTPVQLIQEQPQQAQVQYIRELHPQPTPAQVQFVQEQVEPQPQQVVQVQQQQQQQQQPQQYLVQQDQVTAGDTTSSDDSQAPVIPRRGRIIRRRKKANRRNNPARRI